MSDEEQAVADAEAVEPTPDPVPDAPVPDPIPDPVPDPVADVPVDAAAPTTGEEVPPDAPTQDAQEVPAEVAPQDEMPAEVVAPVKPLRWFLVEYRALAGAVLPLEAAGKFWHANSQHVLAEPCFAKVAKIAGFRAIKDVPMPVGAAPCAGCGDAV